MTQGRQAVNAPACITEALALMRAERDAIDLAITNISQIWGLNVAADRRALLLTVIGRAEVGLTISELKKATPKMDPKDRQNALSVLKSKGEIRRAGNAWVKAV